MKPVEIKPNIFWVGVIDWSIRDFHGYITPKGTTYNNYLILDKEVTLIDTVKEGFSEVMLKNIAHLTSVDKIKNIVINHIENDHASALGNVMDLVPSAKIFTSAKGKEGLSRFFDISKWDINVVKTGDKINIGSKTLLFIETPMLHWPDSMMTYVCEDELLISQDAFGQHLATSARFDDEFINACSLNELQDAVIDYYANILMPFGFIIKPKIEELNKL